MQVQTCLYAVIVIGMELPTANYLERTNYHAA